MPLSSAPVPARAARAARTLTHWAARASARLWPARCAACDLVAGDPFCAACERDYFNREVNRCQQCGIALVTTDRRCATCVRTSPAFDATVVGGDYAAPVSRLVLALKASGRLSLARAFGRLLAARIEPGQLNDALLVAVPLAHERERERGFNQSVEIGRALARAAGLQLRHDVLARTRHAPPQHLLDLESRRRNLRGAFVVRAPVVDRHVAVIDDVMTTGSTANEIARTLKRAGAVRVTNLMVARTA